MIGFFTDPYPDELLYSACARYHTRARNLSKEATARDLFGNNRAKIVVDFPTRLNYLATQLPSVTYSVNQLIDKHTLLPFYSPFMPRERHATLRQDMHGEGGGSLHARLGLLTSGIDVKKLRFCALCVEDDQRRYGEPYWHRIHQTPGVEVCLTHSVFLSISGVSVRNRGNGQAFMTARHANAELLPVSRVARQLDAKNREHSVLINIARDAAWILNTQIEVPDQAMLRRRYLRLLLERKLATYAGTVGSHVRLKAQFIDYYSSELLQQLGCGLEVQYHWLRRLVNDWKRSRHPLHHLLLMQFLDCPAEEFFRLPIEVEPFGKGPWPCLNAVSEHYRDARIAECQINHTQDKTKRLMGTFHCECGFSYRRIGPDTRDERRFEYDWVMNFGETWYEKLRGMLAVGDHSSRAMARVLGVSRMVVKAEIERLEKARESNQPLARRFVNRNAPLVGDSDLREKYRKQWIEVRTENKDVGRARLGYIAHEAYIWLLKHDKKWLEDNFPKRLRRGSQRPKVDWLKRDEKYSTAVRKTAANMQNIVGRPIWVSRTRLAKTLGILAVVNKTSAKLPLTNNALDEVSESITCFAIRRICWAADCYYQEHVPADKWKLQMRAAVSNKMARVPEVKAAFEECVRTLREMNEVGWECSAKGSG
jgi:Tn7-like transposition protein D/TniQ protein